jgi:hypothetical protein
MRERSLRVVQASRVNHSQAPLPHGRGSREPQMLFAQSQTVRSLLTERRT